MTEKMKTRIYMDVSTCDVFDVTYYVKGQKVSLTPVEIISARMRSGKTYDSSHMKIFENHGMQRAMVLEHKGIGWFEVINENR